MIKICEYCQTEYKTNSHHNKEKAAKQKHCSVECRRKHQAQDHIGGAEYMRRRRLNLEYHKKELERKRIFNHVNRQKRHDYYLVNKERNIIYNREHIKKRREENVSLRVGHQIGCMVRKSLKSGKNGDKTFSVLGYTLWELEKHLENNFTQGMAWDNYGEWHIDHKIPLCAFNITSVGDVDFRRAWSLSNLQPLWKHDNIMKRGKVEHPFQPSLAISF